MHSDHVIALSGQPKKTASTAANKGTIVKATDLFKNLPVRKNYFKSAKRKKDDLAKVEKLTKAYAIVRPDLRITLFHNNVQLFVKPACSDVMASVRHVFNSQEVRGMTELEFESPENVKFQIVLPAKDRIQNLIKSDNSETFVFVNGRPVVHKDIEKVLRRSHPGAEGNSRSWPKCVAKIQLPQENLDVNLDANKESVLIEKQSNLVDYLEHQLKDYYGIAWNESVVEDLNATANSSDTNCSFLYNNTTSQESLESLSAIFSNKDKAPPQLQRPANAKSKENPAPGIRLFEAEPSQKENKMSNSDRSYANPGSPKASSTRFGLSNISDDKSSGEGFSFPQPGTKEWSKGVAVTDQTGKPVSATHFVSHEKDLNEMLSSTQSLITSYCDDNPFERDRNLSSANNAKRKVKASPDDFAVKSKPKKAKPVCDEDDDQFIVEPSNRDRSIQTYLKRKSPKKNKIENLDGPMSKESRKSQRKVCNVKVDLNKVATPRKVPKIKNSFQPHIIGSLKPSGSWVGNLSKNSLAIINHNRVQELVLYQKLMQTHILPSQPKGLAPIDIVAESNWNPELTKALMEVNFSDPRITMNGLKIGLSEVGKKPMLFEVCPNVSFMGVSDILEILKVLRSNPEASIEQCRPVKVKAYLKSEAVRMARQSPTMIDFSTASKFLNVIISRDVDVCLHSKPLFHEISKNLYRV